MKNVRSSQPYPSMNSCTEFSKAQVLPCEYRKCCQPTYPFPREFHVTQTENHWANENTSIDLIKEVLVPHVRKVRQKLSLPEDLQWLLIADIFKGHWTDAVVTEVKRSIGKICAIPNNMTNIFHPLDLSVNRSCKFFLRREAQPWHSLQIEKQMKEGKKAHEINVDTRISIMTPLHAKWVVLFYDYMKNHSDMVLAGWRKSKIEEVFNSEENLESDPFL